MRQTIHKCFFVWDFDKEEQWLNEMAAKGLALVSVGFCKYEFEDCVPGEYRVCLQLLDKLPRHPEMQKYIEFMEETGQNMWVLSPGGYISAKKPPKAVLRFFPTMLPG